MCIFWQAWNQQPPGILNHFVPIAGTQRQFLGIRVCKAIPGPSFKIQLQGSGTTPTASSPTGNPRTRIQRPGLETKRQVASTLPSLLL